MRIIKQSSEQIVIQVEDFHAGYSKFELFDAFAIFLLLVCLSMIEATPFFQMIGIGAILFSGVLFVSLEMKPKPAKRKPRDNYTFNQSTGIIEGFSSNQGKSKTYLNEITNIELDFFIQEDADSETGITTMRTDGEYKIAIKFKNQHEWQLEYNQCGFFKPPESQQIFRDLIADSDKAVKTLRTLLDLEEAQSD
jgi:hypothetical protein